MKQPTAKHLFYNPQEAKRILFEKYKSYIDAKSLVREDGKAAARNAKRSLWRFLDKWFDYYPIGFKTVGGTGMEMEQILVNKEFQAIVAEMHKTNTQEEAQFTKDWWSAALASGRPLTWYEWLNYTKEGKAYHERFVGLLDKGMIGYEALDWEHGITILGYPLTPQQYTNMVLEKSLDKAQAEIKTYSDRYWDMHKKVCTYGDYLKAHNAGKAKMKFSGDREAYDLIREEE
jgi:hypothetical protein